MAYPEGQLFYYIGNNYHVVVAPHVSDDIASRALEILLEHPEGEVHYTMEDGDVDVYLADPHARRDGVEGIVTYRSHHDDDLDQDVDFLRIAHDSGIMYLSRNRLALENLSRYLQDIPETPAFTIQGLQQFAFANDYPTDFFVSLTGKVGGRWRRKRMLPKARSPCGPALHKHTPLSWRVSDFRGSTPSAS